MPVPQQHSHKTLWVEGIHFMTFKNLFKSLLPGREHQEEKGEQLWVPLYLQSSSVPRSLGWGQAGITYLFLIEKKRSFPCETKAICTLISPCLSQDISAVFPWLSLITNPIPILKKLSWLGKEREKHWFIFLPILLLPPLSGTCCSAALSYEHFAAFYLVAIKVSLKEGGESLSFK